MTCLELCKQSGIEPGGGGGDGGGGLVTKSCLTLEMPMDYSPSDSSVHGILQARILEWVAISFSRENQDSHSNNLPMKP